MAREGKRRTARVALLCLTATIGAACGGGASAGGPDPASQGKAGAAAEPVAPSEAVVIGQSADPSLYLGAAADQPAFGIAAPGLVVTPTGPAQNGRTPVRITGPVRASGWIPSDLLGLKVQRRGTLRGTQVYLGPDDPVRLLGPAQQSGRVRLSAAPVVGGQALGPFEGTYPAIGVAPHAAPASSQPPAPGQAHELAAGTEMPLYDQPGGTVQQVVPAQPDPLQVAVLGAQGNWYAVRVGEGPYLIGYTDTPLKSLGTALEVPPPSGPRSEQPSAEVPAPLQKDEGTLKRIAKGAELVFNGQVVAVFDAPGWARVKAEYPNNQVDVFAAVSDRLAVRGLVNGQFLSDPPAQP